MDQQREEIWLFEVADVFHLSRLGFTVVGQLGPSEPPLKVGEPLVFHCLGGVKVTSAIKSIPMISRRLDSPKDKIAFELPKTPETLRITGGAQVFRVIPSSV